jgi:N12 class adenine-specific DNA methylase
VVSGKEQPAFNMLTPDERAEVLRLVREAVAEPGGEAAPLPEPPVPEPKAAAAPEAMPAEPSRAQAEAGNYRMRHITIPDLGEVTIETAKPVPETPPAEPLQLDMLGGRPVPARKFALSDRADRFLAEARATDEPEDMLSGWLDQATRGRESAKSRPGKEAEARARGADATALRLALRRLAASERPVPPRVLPSAQAAPAAPPFASQPAVSETKPAEVQAGETKAEPPPPAAAPAEPVAPVAVPEAAPRAAPRAAPAPPPMQSGKRFEKGDRIVLVEGPLKGRTGEVIEATHVRFAPIFGGEPSEVTSVYRVRTDQGTESTASANEIEAGGAAPQGIVRDPLVDGSPVEPIRAWREPGELRARAGKVRERAKSRRREDLRKADLAAADDLQRQAAAAEATIAAWINANPEEALRALPINEDHLEWAKYAAKRYKTAGDETSAKLAWRRASAKTEKWAAGDGVGWRVTRDQINRGYRIVEVDEDARTATIAAIADTGLTTTGGDTDFRYGETKTVPLGDLVRDRKYDGQARPGPRAEAPRAPEGAASSSGVLRVEPLSDKSIIIRGETRANMERIKAAVPGFKPLWNKTAVGWVFPKARETEVRRGLADLLGPAVPPEDVTLRPSPSQEPAAPVEVAAPQQVTTRPETPDWWQEIGSERQRLLAEKAGVGGRAATVRVARTRWADLSEDDRARLTAVHDAEAVEPRPSPESKPEAPEWFFTDLTEAGRAQALILAGVPLSVANRVSKASWKYLSTELRQKLEQGALELRKRGGEREPEGSEPPEPAVLPAAPAALGGEAAEGAAAIKKAKGAAPVPIDVRNRAAGWIGGMRRRGVPDDQMLDLLDESVEDQIQSGMPRAYARQIAAEIKRQLKAAERAPAAEVAPEIAPTPKAEPAAAAMIQEPLAPPAPAPDITTGKAEIPTDVARTDDTAPAPDDRAGDEGPGPEPAPGARGERPAGAGDQRPGGRDARGEERGAGRGGEPVQPGDERAGVPASDERGVGGGPRGGAGVPAGELTEDYSAPEGSLARTGSWHAVAERNLDAVELLGKLETEGRRATPEEQAVLAEFRGWGASEIANNLFPSHAVTRTAAGTRLDPEHVYNQQWRPTIERAARLLQDEDLETALRSTQYGHYTSEPVVRALWGGVERLGFKGGKILEPGMGTGRFPILAPKGVMAASRYTGIEFDRFTAAVAKQLLPREHVIHADYVKQKLPDGFFDLAIGNPPFAKTIIIDDPAYRALRFSLHDYFFAKSIDKVRPGGLLVFITSRYTMDKQNDKARAFIADRADLIGAIRLPQTAFKQDAGTEVVTDVLFLQRRAPGQTPGGESWLGHQEVPTEGGSGTPALVNEYFAAHPEMVLGRHARERGMYREDDYTVLPLDKDIAESVREATARLPEGIYQEATRKSVEDRQEQAVERDFDIKAKKEGQLYVHTDGRLMRVEDGSGVPLDSVESLSPKSTDWLKDAVHLRESIKAAQKAQLDNDETWEAKLKVLNSKYHDFVEKHGRIRAFKAYEKKTTDADGVETVNEYRRFKNDRLINMDVEGQLLTGLETIDEDGNIAKSPFLAGRTLRKPARPEIVTTQDALFVSLDERGRLDLDHIAELIGKSRDETIEALGAEVYETPAGQWQTADEYLSGDVVAKLAEARVSAEADQRFRRNVTALQERQPRPLKLSEVNVPLGAGWVPPTDMEAFADEVLRLTVKLTYEPTVGKWSMEAGRTGRRARESASEWGTSDRSAQEIFEAALNNRQIKVTRTEKVPGVGTRTWTDQVATAGANEKADKMRVAFKQWIWTEGERAKRLIDDYNERFNNLAPRRFDGSHLTLPGLSLKYALHPHQKRAVWRIMQTGDTYLGHAVGAGKTLEMIVSAMEQRRLGLIRKPLFVVPNHMLEQFASEFMDAYPAAKIMVADDKAFHTTRRQRFIAQAALNDLDGIIVTHSAFGLLGTKDETRTRLLRPLIEELNTALNSLGGGQDTRISRKKIEKQIEALIRRFTGATSQEEKDQGVQFEDMGVDMLYIDEAHQFRKLDFATDMGTTKGIDPEGSAMAIDLFIKSRWLGEQRPGRSMVLASGTPVTNTMAELFSVMRFLANDMMVADGIQSFDAWARQFGEVATQLEQNAAGKYEPVSRFSRFVNLPELMKRVRSFMDVLTSNQLRQLVKVPDIEGGGPANVITKASPAQLDYMESVLLPRIKVSRAWKPSPNQPGNPDPIVNIITDGQLSAIDMRFVDPKATSDPKSKLNVMIDGMIKTYKGTSGDGYADPRTGLPEPVKGSAQIVFSALGFGEQVAARRGFDVRGWMMGRFAKAGIPASAVAWMSDYGTAAKKQAMFKEVRNGRKRILIGSPKNMGTGLNVQKRLKELHFLTPPWYPSDVEQPHGRIVRQGNLNPSVVLNWYATKGTYDSTKWGMVARKARFIEQAFTGDDTLRTMDDLSAVSHYEMASAMAAGDERAIRLANLNVEIDRLQLLLDSHHDEQMAARSKVDELDWRIGNGEVALEKLSAAEKKVEYIHSPKATVGKEHFTKHGEIGTALLKSAESAALRWEPTSQKYTHQARLGMFMDKYPINVQLSKNGPFTNIALVLKVDQLETEIAKYLVEITDGQHAVTITQRMQNYVNDVPERRRTTERAIEELKEERAAVKKQIGAPFARGAELIEKTVERARLLEELQAEGAATSEQGLPEREAIERWEGEGGLVRYRRGPEPERRPGAEPPAAPGEPTFEAIAREMRDLLRRIAGSRVRVDVQGRLLDPAGNEVLGAYLKGVVSLALSGYTPAQVAATARHEAIHFLRETGAIPAAAWKVLAARAPAWRKQLRTDERYAGQGLTEEQLNEEAVADAFAAWAGGKAKAPTAVVSGIFARIKRVLQAIRDALRKLWGGRLPTAEEVFAAIERGAMATAAEAPGGDAGGAGKYQRAWHGTPNEWAAEEGAPLGRLDLSKMGTGEGAQMIAWGGYFSSKSEIAEYYRHSLTRGGKGQLSLAGVVPSSRNEGLSDSGWMSAKNLSQLLVPNAGIGKPFSKLDIVARRSVVSAVRNLLEDAKVLDAVVSLIPIDVVNMLGGKQLTSKALLDNPTMLIDLLPVNAEDLVPSRIAAMDVLSVAVALAAAKVHTGLSRFDISPSDFGAAGRAGGHGVPDVVMSKIPHPSEFRKGRLYEVELAPDDADLLDWDAPLSEQSEKVKAAISGSPALFINKTFMGSSAFDSREIAERVATANLKLKSGEYQIRPVRLSGMEMFAVYGRPGDATEGETIYQALASELGGARAASLALRDAGIPGIRYKDASARGTERESFNYVIFDESAVTVTGRFARPAFVSEPDRGTAGHVVAAVRTGLRDPVRWFRETLVPELIRGSVNRLNPIFEMERRSVEMDRAAGGSPRTAEPGDTLLSAEVSGAKLAEMAVQDSGLFEMLHLYGPPIFDPATNAIRPDTAVGGLADILQFESPADYDAFQGYAYANRAQRLLGEGRERLMSPAEITAALNVPAADKRRYDAMIAKYQRFNDTLLQYLVDTGVIRQDSKDAYASTMDYVPFYRRFDETGDLIGPSDLRSGLSNPDPKIRRLLGGTARLGDLIDNIAQNARVLVTAGRRNVALRYIRDTMLAIGEGRDLRGDESKEGSVSWYERGRKRWFLPDDPHLALAMQAEDPIKLGMLYNFLRVIPRIYRAGITLTPQFMLANFIRGSAAAFVQTGKNVHWRYNGITGLVNALRGSESMRELKAISGMGGYRFGPEAPSLTGAALRRGSGAEGPSLWGGIQSALERWERVGEATEFAERDAIYRRLISEGQTKAEAAYQAMNLINYSRRGAWKGLRVLLPFFPFLNARIQGLYRMGERHGTPGVLGSIALRGALFSAFSAGLWALNNSGDDDDENNRRRRWEAEPIERKLNYWIIYPTATSKVLIPKPFEFGALFGTLPEALLDALAGQSGTGSRDLATVAAMTLLNTFAFTVIPQPFLAPAEIYFNYDIFRQRPLENMAQQRLAPGLRSGPTTSSMARYIGETINVSPTKLQHVVEGYLGTSGTMLLAGIDAVAGAGGLLPERPTGAFGSVPVASRALELTLGRFVKAEPEGYTRWVEDFYDLKAEADEAYASARYLAAAGQAEEARQFIAESRGPVSMRKMLDKWADKLSDLTREINRIRATRGLSADEMRDRLEPLIERRNAIAESLVRMSLRATAASGAAVPGLGGAGAEASPKASVTVAAPARRPVPVPMPRPSGLGGRPAVAAP